MSKEDASYGKKFNVDDMQYITCTRVRYVRGEWDDYRVVLSLNALPGAPSPTPPSVSSSVSGRTKSGFSVIFPLQV